MNATGCRLGSLPSLFALAALFSLRLDLFVASHCAAVVDWARISNRIHRPIHPIKSTLTMAEIRREFCSYELYLRNKYVLLQYYQYVLTYENLSNPKDTKTSWMRTLKIQKPYGSKKIRKPFASKRYKNLSDPYDTKYKTLLDENPKDTKTSWIQKIIREIRKHKTRRRPTQYRHVVSVSTTCRAAGARLLPTDLLRYSADATIITNTIISISIVRDHRFFIHIIISHDVPIPRTILRIGVGIRLVVIGVCSD